MNNGPVLKEEHVLSLIREISDQKIKEALFIIGNDKSLGPVGYISYFFKKA